jgi:uncharacterized protein with FMN-binding domain
VGNDSKQNRRRQSGLVALSSAAVIGVYAAGFLKTRSAAQELEGESARRRTAAPVAVVASAAPAPVETRVGPPAAPPDAASAAPTIAPDAPIVSRPAPLHVAPAAPTEPAMPAAAPDSHAAPAPTVIAAAPTTAPVASADKPAVEPLAPIAPVEEAAAPAVESAAASTSLTPQPVGGEAPKPGDAVPIHYKDGKYLGWGSCRHGRIQARVIIENGRITSSSIAKCLTRYNCSWIASLVPEVVERQSADIDYVTGATESADAFYYAVVDALSQAKE